MANLQFLTRNLRLVLLKDIFQSCTKQRIYALTIFGRMKPIKLISHFYINSSIHVALAVAALTWITVMEFNLTVPKALWIFIFFGTITAYNFVKYAKVAGLHHRSLTHSLRAIQIFSGLSLGLFLYSVFLLPWNVLLISAALGIPTFFYAVPIFHHNNLRSLAGIKIFVVSFVWAGLTVITPMLAAEAHLSVDIVLTFFQRMLIVGVLIFPLEIRDVPYDSLNLKTLPQQIGIWGTKFLGEGILLLCLAFEFFKHTTDKAYLLSLLIFAIFLGGLLMVSKPTQSRYFSSFWIEGLPVFWWMLYVILTIPEIWD